ncbi:hypothetical protein BH11PSE3_BH11PSE3_12460 [soil metagenome]
MKMSRRSLIRAATLPAVATAAGLLPATARAADFPEFGKAWRQDVGIDLIAAGGAGNDEPKPPIGPIADLR